MKCDWKTEFKCSAVAMRMHSHSVMENGEGEREREEMGNHVTRDCKCSTCIDNTSLTILYWMNMTFESRFFLLFVNTTQYVGIAVLIGAFSVTLFVVVCTCTCIYFTSGFFPLRLFWFVCLKRESQLWKFFNRYINSVLKWKFPLELHRQLWSWGFLITIIQIACLEKIIKWLLLAKRKWFTNNKWYDWHSTWCVYLFKD